MSQVSAPYRFVPLSPLVVLPDWADRVSHDVPLADGLCGELRLTLTTHTPLCVGGAQDKATEREPGKVHFFRTPDGELAIPGSSIKGMLRNVLEIASFGRFSQVEDQRLGVRDIKAEFYMDMAKPQHVRTGWLKHTPKGWSIMPCSVARLHQSDLINYLNIPESTWLSAEKAEARYALIDQYGKSRHIRFDTQSMPDSTTGRKDQRAAPSPSGKYNGVVVVTGQPLRSNFKGEKSKKYEFVFFGEIEQEPISVPEETMLGFKQIYSKTDEWNFWSDGKNQINGYGIPVFYHGTHSSVSSMGLSLLYKIPYRHSLHQAIRHTSDAHLDSDSPDLAALIFGHLDNTPGASLRSRVNIGLASVTSTPQTGWTSPTVLNSPKPTFYPAYIRQKNDRDLCQLMQNDAELAGWKRYPTKPAQVLPPPEKSKPTVQVQLETVPAGTAFRLAIRLHNLRPVELGALLWCLDFGGRPELRHGLGMGKPYGLGQVSLQIDDALLRHNDPSRDGASHDDLLMTCRDSFIDMMTQALSQSAPEEKSWETCGPIVALLDHARPSSRTTDLDYLPDPKSFIALKHSNALGEVKQTFHKDKPVQANSLPAGKTHHYEEHFDALLAEAPARRAAAAEKAARERAMEDASEEDRALLQLEALLAEAGNSPSATQKKNINKMLSNLYAISVNMDSAQQTILRQLATQADTLGDNKIHHIVKKIVASTDA